MAITGLEYFRLRSASENQSVYGVIVTTPTKLYQFHATLNTTGVNKLEEKPLLQPLFHSYLNVKGISLKYMKKTNPTHFTIWLLFYFSFYIRKIY